ncbi:MAG: acetyl-CoA carboxylase biotin carboxyl carrier protein subunit [Bacteroidota bacterium]
MQNQYQVTVEDHTWELEGSALDAIRLRFGVFHILKNNKAYRATLIAADHAHKTFSIEVNGSRYEVRIADRYDQLVEQLGLSTASAQRINDVKAPMPGLVLGIEVEAGQRVEKGQGLLILEAMKMENVIKSVGEGIVKSVCVEQGMAVEKGQLLIEMEAL